jgi:hypothetical protein
MRPTFFPKKQTEVGDDDGAWCVVRSAREGSPIHLALFVTALPHYPLREVPPRLILVLRPEIVQKSVETDLECVLHRCSSPRRCQALIESNCIFVQLWYLRSSKLFDMAVQSHPLPFAAWHNFTCVPSSLHIFLTVP